MVVDPLGRSSFGENWARFLSVVDEERISAAESSLLDMLGADTLRNRDALERTSL